MVVRVVLQDLHGCSSIKSTYSGGFDFCEMSPQLPETMTLKKHVANSPVSLLEYRITARDSAVSLDEQLRIHVVNWGMESWGMSSRASPLEAVSWRYLGRDLAW